MKIYFRVSKYFSAIFRKQKKKETTHNTRHKKHTQHRLYVMLSSILCWFACSPEGVRAHAKGARAGHESSADLAS